MATGRAVTDPVGDDLPDPDRPADSRLDGSRRQEADGGRGSPRYRHIAIDLQEKIANGTYAVGQNLPTEAMLCRTFGVSRHTVREALKRLAGRGLVERRRAVGTLVRARYPEGHYRQPLPSAAALLELPSDLRAEVVARGMVTADTALARALDCAEARRWAWLGIVRRAPEGPPVAWTDLYICPALVAAGEAPSLDGASSMTPSPTTPFQEAPFQVATSLAAANAAVEKGLMDHADSIDVVVDARRLTVRQAEHLAVDPEAAALSVLRRLRNGSGTYCVSISLHPQGRFGFEAQMSRCWRPGEPPAP